MQTSDGVNFVRSQRILLGFEEDQTGKYELLTPASEAVLYWAPLGGNPDFDFPDEEFPKPWDPENTEDDALRYHRSEMRKLEGLLLTYQECDCEKTEEVLAAIRLIRDSLNNRN
jgi:hypothetical protein